MINAQEAYKKTIKQKSDMLAEELALCEEKISRAITIGRNHCYVYRVIGTQTQEELIKLGYAIYNRSNQKNGATWLISWGMGGEKNE